ncbi:hypothetical protein [Nocardia arthritidis]|uniref:Uncharacterized protein n=1 Tax=Nocardia arthritidis TaxID=228602 RepID=A0A6G9YCE5_9NOCA|nr:hypothetical protein [Nocardia arthritidis]QIS10810.1 hypothetical protein F5544_14625 [Nocardia arthritidis]
MRVRFIRSQPAARFAHRGTGAIEVFLVSSARRQAIIHILDYLGEGIIEIGQARDTVAHYLRLLAEMPPVKDTESVRPLEVPLKLSAVRPHCISWTRGWSVEADADDLVASACDWDLGRGDPVRRDGRCSPRYRTALFSLPVSEVLRRCSCGELRRSRRIRSARRIRCRSGGRRSVPAGRPAGTNMKLATKWFMPVYSV